MTLISPFSLKRKLVKIKNIRTPTEVNIQDISIVVPVKNNQKGINKLLLSLQKLVSESIEVPSEIIIVDDNSLKPIVLYDEYKNLKYLVKIITSNKRGVSAARNIGWKTATGKWIMFTDSDCVLTHTTFTGYRHAMNGSIAYAGNVVPLDSDVISKFYAAQEVLLPYKIREKNTPMYIVTANCLIWKEGLSYINGFDEYFVEAAGEDIDLGLRIAQYGDLAFATNSLILHDFSDGFLGFVERFYRYGKALKKIKKIYELKQIVIWLRIVKNNPIHLLLGLVMNLVYNIGYFKQRS